MEPTYLHVIVLTHIGFGCVFFFLNRQRANRFAEFMAWCWGIEAIRAVILLPTVNGIGGFTEAWYALADVLCFFANWCLLAACADLAGKRPPAWLAPVYFWSGIPLVLFNRYFLPMALHTAWGVSIADGHFRGVAINLFVMFVPVALTRLTILVWLASIWKKTRLPGALIAAGFMVPYGAVAIAAPFQFLYSYNPRWIMFLWCVRVIGFSIGAVMLLLSLQQAALVRSEKNLLTAQGLAKLGSWELDLGSGLARWSAEMWRLWGREPSEHAVSREDFLAAIQPEDRDNFERTQLCVGAEGEGVQTEFKLQLPNGTVRWMHGRSTSVRDGTGKIAYITGTAQDITERKQAEAQMALQQAVTRALAEAGPVQPAMRKILEIIGRGLDWEFGAAWMLDRTTKSLRCSEIWTASPPAFADFAETTRNSVFVAGEELPGGVLSARKPQVTSDVSRDNAVRRRAEAASAGLGGGVGFPLMVRSEVLGVVEFFSTRIRQPGKETPAIFAALGTQIGQFIERQRLEEQYRQAQRMEAVGTLAGGIAHDFNNILTAINGYSELARLEAGGDSRVSEHLNAVQEAARRAVDLVRQIMAFSRQEELVRVPTQLRPVVAEALKLLRATIPSTVEINAVYDEDIHPVLANATSIHQVAVNLGTNAWQAMKNRAGRIDVRLENFEVDEDFAMRIPGLQAGSYICLSVADTGDGMDEATLARIFEPFFTTKPAGEGTGLGLAVVHGIVQSHEGAVAVYSQPGEGTRFNLYFPALRGSAVTSKRTQLVQIARGHGERILYVDDEKALADMGKKILERLGYVVEAHYDSNEALLALKSNIMNFDLVVTDLTMPMMTGLELAKELQEIRPDLPIVLTTGYAATLTPERFQSVGVREVLLKPHSVETLAAAVERVLAAQTKTGAIKFS